MRLGKLSTRAVFVLINDDIDWRARAKCRDHNPELWFPITTGNRLRALTAAPAVKICRTCPVQADCLHWAITTGETWAIAGGKDFGANGRHAATKGGK